MALNVADRRVRWGGVPAARAPTGAMIAADLLARLAKCQPTPARATLHGGDAIGARKAAAG